MMRYLAFIFLLFLSVGCARRPESATKAQEAFMGQFKPLCEKAFPGVTVFPKKGDPFAGKDLSIVVRECGARETRVQFRVGDDHSRTWILTRSRKGLTLKHDHRQPDGTPDEITMYGGTAQQDGTGLSQSFPADAQTGELIPAGKNNIWTLEFNPDKNTLDYILKRDGTLRYQARFDLAKPLAGK